MTEATVQSPVAQVLPGIWRATNEVVSGRYRLTNNAYLIVDQGEAALVDTAWWHDEGAHLDALFAASGVAPSAVTTIVLTHAHRDHAGNADRLAARTGATVALHRAEQSTVESLAGYQGLPDEASAVRWYEAQGFPTGEAQRIVRGKLPDREFDVSRPRWLTGDETIRVGSRRLEVIETPGHTPGHVCLLERATGVLFSGDALLPRGHGNPHVTVRAFTPPDPLSDYVAGIESLRAEGGAITVCLPGHGPVVADPLRLIDDHLRYAEAKLEPAAAALDSTPRTAFDIVSRMPWRGGSATFADLDGDELFLSFADGLARLRRLVSLGHAARRLDGALELYSLASLPESDGPR
ncbi:MBL fold metallo-hydrolase [Microbacterium sp. zg-Y818]|uniref:MBL fold metallo-hydrolase n=1 Tax=unclassified Microbacterium TaxID=2609290 RepID=UPI00214B3D8F|nr:MULTISPECIES: MBL fold metallo-hydrolase [unclassified Microbacterium]MCR2799347.1 MBL fold metallo-hydrolase [Microbacterium sp. zg.Y818]WIM21347.1 MBL fold metallo-hydrolase [Microbacterium sp. zg-Y818]